MMAKSEAITAWIPSFPEIPTPQSAVWIMLTSLAPSPFPWEAVQTYGYHSPAIVSPSLEGQSVVRPQILLASIMNIFHALSRQITPV